MAKKSVILRNKRKTGIQKKNRCFRCGRGRSYLRDFGVCRICFRELVHRGEIPGVVKASW